MPDFKNDVAAFAAIAAIGSAVCDEFLAMEMHHAIAAFARLHVDFYLVCEHRILAACLINEDTFYTNLENRIRMSSLYAHSVHGCGTLYSILFFCGIGGFCVEVAKRIDHHSLAR